MIKPMPMRIGRLGRKGWMWIVAGVLLAIALLYAYAYAKVAPGGIDDWRMSRAMGIHGTIRIPLGDTAAEAVRKFRDEPAPEIVHREPVQGGVMLFNKRLHNEDGTDLQVEYVRKTRFGWKWGWGGGYSVSESANSALGYMSFPEVKGIATPFPMLFGEVLDPSVQRITVEVHAEGDGTRTIAAEQTEATDGRRPVWFASLLPTDRLPFEIHAYDGSGKLVGRKTLNDRADSGLVELMKEG